MITAVLKAGADAKAKDSYGKAAFNYAEGNEKLRGTDAYLQLQKGVGIDVKELAQRRYSMNADQSLWGYLH